MPSGVYPRRPKPAPPTQEELRVAVEKFREAPTNVDARLLAYETLRRLPGLVAQRAAKTMTQVGSSRELDDSVLHLMEYALRGPDWGRIEFYKGRKRKN